MTDPTPEELAKKFKIDRDTADDLKFAIETEAPGYEDWKFGVWTDLTEFSIDMGESITETRRLNRMGQEKYDEYYERQEKMAQKEEERMLKAMAEGKEYNAPIGDFIEIFKNKRLGEQAIKEVMGQPCVQKKKLTPNEAMEQYKLPKRIQRKLQRMIDNGQGDDPFYKIERVIYCKGDETCRAQKCQPKKSRPQIPSSPPEARGAPSAQSLGSQQAPRNPRVPGPL